MKLKTFVSFLLLFGAFSGTFLCVTTQQEDYNDVADNIWDHLPEESPQIEQNQDDSNNDNDKDPQHHLLLLPIPIQQQLLQQHPREI
uniref:Uncharacterized protein n=1 Tax=Meloidogyne enterolobii TaxID=390850 RepID=A0A6V7XTB0_MELEN|nr:unnamed protein product [Meloidogyne enterolobii]CAD2203255.1 unnamed protein product [Meloidogyne enterolobii]